MKKQLFIFQIIILMSSTVLCAQNYFEGQIDYKIEYESLNKNIPKEYLAALIGDSFTAYVKEDRYVMIYNSKGKQGWTKSIIRLDEGFSYMEYEKSDTIFKSRLDQNSDKLIELKKETDQKKLILGEMCSSIVLKYESTDPDFPFKITDGRHYYNPKYKLNPEQYKNYTSGFWNKFIELSESISIRNEHRYEGFFKSISEAVMIDERKIPESTFELNSDKIVVLEK